ncbi:MAG: PA14 domain-containing protein, partial [Oceanipulchritudo sp.]
MRLSPCHRNHWILLPVLLLLLMPSWLSAWQAVGGGLLDSGLEGAWYADADFGGSGGELAFTRRDIRIDFDWGVMRKPGGGLAGTRIGELAADHYSVRWTGRLMPRFSETYTFIAHADSVRIWIKPEGQSEWPASPQIDHWPSSEPVGYPAQEAPIALVAGTAYDIRIDYRERTGAAMMRLLWSSPSTPEEVIQPTAFVGEKPPDRGIILADAMYGASNFSDAYSYGSTDPRNDGELEIGPDGWPTEGFDFVLRPIDQDVHHGTYAIRFKGSAAVRFHITGAEFTSADGLTSFGTETAAGDGYDPATNTTTLLAVVAYGENKGNVWPNFTDTDRDGPQGTAYGTNSGITDLRIMRPVSAGSTTPHGFDEWLARDTKDALEVFTTFRWNDVNGLLDSDGDGVSDDLALWSTRRPFGPDFVKRSDPGENHEYKILFNNAIGRDLYIQVPANADDDYIRKLAQLIRYGADEDGLPHTSEVADPHFPPLNPNLRVFVEYANECPWNTAGQYAHNRWVQNRPEVLRLAADPRWDIINYDGTWDGTSDAAGLASGKRFFALRSVEMSDLFREVFGDDAMPAPGRLDPRVRPLLMYQYDNSNNTARDALFFIDN